MYTMNTYYRLFDIIVKRYKQRLKSVHLIISSTSICKIRQCFCFADHGYRPQLNTMTPTLNGQDICSIRFYSSATSNSIVYLNGST